jgi:AraC-like DNA-binding protein
MNKEEVRNECTRIAEQDEWLTAKELAPRLKMSPSTIYSLVRRGSDIPCASVSKGKILFSWGSVNKWLHQLEIKKKRRNFEE